jgi:hypothetical protein
VTEDDRIRGRLVSFDRTVYSTAGHALEAEGPEALPPAGDALLVSYVRSSGARGAIEARLRATGYRLGVGAERFELAAVCDLDPTRGAALAGDLGVARTCSDADCDILQRLDKALTGTENGRGPCSAQRGNPR